MTSNPNWSDIDGRADLLVHDALERLNSAKDELLLDFSAVRRVDTATLQEMARLASAAQEISVKVAIRGVNVEVYKALKLFALAERFSFS